MSVPQAFPFSHDQIYGEIGVWVSMSSRDRRLLVLNPVQPV
jgi:hypothetical protein